MLQAAINGKRSKQENLNIPVTALEIVREAHDAIGAGAQTIHFHVRDGQGKETFDPAAVALQVGQLRERLPGIPIGISTGNWVEPSLEKRLSLVASWQTLPDYASVNGHEDGFEQVAGSLLTRGVQVEAGIRDTAAAQRYINSGLLNRCFRILIEPVEQELPEALATVAGIERLMSPYTNGRTILLHGFERTTWPMLKIAAERGYASRIGFEDTLLLPDGRPAESNAVLVLAALRRTNADPGS